NEYSHFYFKDKKSELKMEPLFSRKLNQVILQGNIIVDEDLHEKFTEKAVLIKGYDTKVTESVIIDGSIGDQNLKTREIKRIGSIDISGNQHVLFPGSIEKNTVIYTENIFVENNTVYFYSEINTLNNKASDEHKMGSMQFI